MAYSTTGARGDLPELASLSLSDTIRRIKKGLSAEAFEALRRELGVSQEHLARVVRIAPRTLTRRLNEGHFDANESERIYRVVRVFEAAARMLDSREDARAWMTESNRVLGGTSPLDYSDTEPGALEVERLIHRLEHGVFL